MSKFTPGIRIYVAVSTFLGLMCGALLAIAAGGTPIQSAVIVVVITSIFWGTSYVLAKIYTML